MTIPLRASPIIFAVFCGHAMAGPADYVLHTYGMEGQRDIIFSAGSQSNIDEPRTSAASIALGYNVNDFWFSDIYFEYVREGGNGMQFDATSLQNILRLTHGQYPVDVALFTELERPQDHGEGYKITLGPLLEMELGKKTQLNVNLLFSRNVRADSPGPTSMGYQWQVKYRLHHLLEPGLQGFGDLGPWNHWARSSEQSNQIGPALFGSYTLASHSVIRYDVAYLFETTSAKQKNAFRLRTVFEF